MASFETNLDELIGEKTAKQLVRAFEIKTVEQLLRHYPRRYLQRGQLTPMSQLPIGESVTILAEVEKVNTRPIKGKKGSILEVTITDGSASAKLTFFNQSWRANQLAPGSQGLFAGKTSIYSGQIQLAHPDYELFDESSDVDPEAWAKTPIPIYPASSTVPSWRIQKLIKEILAQLEFPEEPLPEPVRDELGVLTLEQALNLIHQPSHQRDFEQAQKTLKTHEALGLLLEFGLIRKQLSAIEVRKREPGKLLETFDSTLPYQLTSAQKKVGTEIEADLASGTPMNRLLQGDVGSGKTIVALRSMLAAIEDGSQAAIIAPTEVLATQHFIAISDLLGDLGNDLQPVLLTGQMSQTEQRKALLKIVSGSARIIIGTHSLISERVEFFDLALAVIDEQHRFGVEQREALRSKGENVHTLIMTATPIPRTLAVTIFGDLSVSILDEKPAERQKIATHVVNVSEGSHVSRVWQRVSEEVQSGSQAFVVCPRIELSDQDEGEGVSAAAVEVAHSLRSNPYLKNARIGLLHGRMPADEKTQTMSEFASGEIDVLVSTTVIEVGVDVPNATAMVILDADRFGLAQLHQLRGRVGRGSKPSVCLLLTASEAESEAYQRLTAMEKTDDGFELSEVDLLHRKEGDVTGISQSGTKSRLKLLGVVRDQQIISDAQPVA
ncbi:MAG TPA: ATP-dependent DNA helicase RecG, partial [Microbacteriaceae bacterium]